jgi:hypothetical protein
LLVYNAEHAQPTLHASKASGVMRLPAGRLAFRVFNNTALYEWLSYYRWVNNKKSRLEEEVVTQSLCLLLFLCLLFIKLSLITCSFQFLRIKPLIYKQLLFYIYSGIGPKPRYRARAPLLLKESFFNSTCSICLTSGLFEEYSLKQLGRQLVNLF